MSATWKAIASSAARAICAEVGSAGEADDRAARIGIPVRSAQSGKRRDEVDAAAIGHAGRQLLDVGRGANDPQSVAKPLNDRARNENAALQGILGSAIAVARRRWSAACFCEARARRPCSSA